MSEVLFDEEVDEVEVSEEVEEGEGEEPVVHMESSYNQLLAQILTACPRLNTLSLQGHQVTNRTGW